MLSAQVIQNQLTKNFINSVAWHVGLNPDVLFQIKILKDKHLCKHVPQEVKGFFSV